MAVVKVTALPLVTPEETDIAYVVDDPGGVPISSKATVTSLVPPGSISTAKIANSAVETAKIADLNVTEGKIAAGAVTNTKLGNGSVDSNKLADDSVITSKILNLNVTTGKLADQAVTYAKIQNSGAANVVLCRSAGTAGAYGEVALAASQLLGRGDSGNIAAITVGNNLSLVGTTLSADWCRVLVGAWG